MAILYEDWTQGIRFARNPDGAVEFSAPEKDDTSGRREYRTYRASSMDDFKKKYPQLVEKYDLDKLVTVRDVPGGDAELREWLGLADPSQGKEESEGRHFGVMLSPVGPALATQLGLHNGEGLVVRQVEPGSLAEKSGVKRHDVITALNGEKTRAQKIAEFRKSLQEALGTNVFALELIRGGKRETIQVKPTPEKEEKKVK
jgi:C-terminal processing protease CtpA/Prc